MQIGFCLLFATLGHTQRIPSNFFLTDFHNSNGQFRQQFFDPYGNAHGAYSYVNPSGQIVRVQYSTGAAQPQRILPQFPTIFSSRYQDNFEDVFNTPLETNSTAPARNLFTPAVSQYPAATAGQLENYRKALEEYANASNTE